MLPTDAPEWAADRERLWNAAELAETRKNATVAREYEIALPVELSADERRVLALGLARAISERHGGSEERRGGKACGSKCRTWWSSVSSKKNNKPNMCT